MIFKDYYNLRHYIRLLLRGSESCSTKGRGSEASNSRSLAACYSREERAKKPTRFRLSVTGSVRKESDLLSKEVRVPGTFLLPVGEVRRADITSKVNRKPHPSSLSRKVIRAGSSFSLPKPHTRENYGSRTKGEKASMLMA